MKMVTAEEIEEELAFAKKAAARFAKDPTLITWREAEVIPGMFMALRWGVDGDCVVVIKLDENHIPTNYQNLVRSEAQ